MAAALSVLSKSTSRRCADFFFGAVCFFFPVGPRWGLRAGPLSLRKGFVVSGEQQHKSLNLLFPQGPSTAEVPKAVGQIGLVASVFEAERGAEIGQRCFVHAVAVFVKKQHQ